MFIFKNNNCKLPVIIWGTATAAEISYQVLRKLNIPIMAAGDNNPQKIGGKWNDLPIISAQELHCLYPNALVVVSTFFHTIAKDIVVQLKGLSEQFTFCRFEEIEYLYEIECLKRPIRDKEKFYGIINHVHQNEEYIWKRMVDKRVISEYRYVVKDKKAQDLKDVLSSVYGLKNLVLIVSSERIQDSFRLVNDLFEYENIGHMILVLEDGRLLNLEISEELVGKIFYVILEKSIEEKVKADLSKKGFIVDTRKILQEVFREREVNHKARLTEKVVVQTVLKYINRSNDPVELDKYQDMRQVYIVQLFNGLANQSLMYLFGKYLEEESGNIVIFDDTILSLDVYDVQENERRMQRWNNWEQEGDAQALVAETKNRNSFYLFKRAELAEVFDIPIRLLSDYFEEDVWREYLERVKREYSYKYAQSFPLGQILIDSGVDITVVRDSIMPDDFFAVDECYCLDAYVLDMPYAQDSVTNFLFHRDQNLYCVGIWATGKVEDCFLGNRAWVRRQLPFRLELNETSKKYMEEICQADGIMIHIRRGDFAFLNISADVKYFQNSIQVMEGIQEYKNKKYFVFSDDLDWCRKNERLLGIEKVKSRTVFVSGNTGVNNYLDLFLMSLGKAIIPTPGSSFSYTAMLISKSIEKCIDVPRYVYNLEHGINSMPVIIDV